MPSSGHVDKLENLVKVLDRMVENLQKKFAESEKTLSQAEKKLAESEKKIAELEKKYDGIEKIMVNSVEAKAIKAVEKASKDRDTQLKLFASLSQLNELERRIKTLESRK